MTSTPCHAQCNQIEVLREEVRRLRAIVATDPQLSGPWNPTQPILREALEHADAVLASTQPPRKVSAPPRLSSAERAACAAWATASGLEEEEVTRGLQRLTQMIRAEHHQLSTIRLTTRNPIQAVLCLADAVASASSATHRIMIATMAFGISGPALMPLLVLGTERLEALALCVPEAAC